MQTHTFKRHRALLQHLGLASLCAVLAFTVGLKTAGEVHTFETSQAADSEEASGQRVVIRGDMSGNGFLDVSDALLLLQVADGLIEPTPEDLRRGDLNGDLRITTEDARRVLHSLTLR